MMIDWNKYHQQFGARVGELMKVSPDTVKGYQTLSAANSATTKLGEKTRQLISLAVAVTTKCDGCIVHHTEAALKAGASREEIAEALGVTVSGTMPQTLPARGPIRAPFYAKARCVGDPSCSSCNLGEGPQRNESFNNYPQTGASIVSGIGIWFGLGHRFLAGRRPQDFEKGRTGIPRCTSRQRNRRSRETPRHRACRRHGQGCSDDWRKRSIGGSRNARRQAMALFSRRQRRPRRSHFSLRPTPVISRRIPGRGA